MSNFSIPINLSEFPTTETALQSKIEGTITLVNIMGELKTLQGILNVGKSEQNLKLDEISENKFYNKEDKNEPLEDNVLMEWIRWLISFRSVEAILDNFPGFAYDRIMKCFVCKTCTDKPDNEKSGKSKVKGGRLVYDHDFGMTFSSDEKLPAQFVHLKAHVKYHLLS